VGGALIPTRPIGTSGLELSVVGLGTAPLGDLKRCPTPRQASDLLQAAWDAGLRYFDTAPFYGCGLAERRTGDFLRDKPRDAFVLSSKVGRLLVPDRAWSLDRYDGDARAMPFRPVFDFSYDAIMKSFEQSLQRLGLERIDILLLHDLGRMSQRDNHEASLLQALEGGGVRALQELRSSGAVKAIGAGVNEWEVLDLLLDHGRWDVFLLANRYTLLDQAVLDHFLPRCLREGVAIVDGAPLNGGILATGAVPGAHYNYAPPSPEIAAKVSHIEAICRKWQTPMVRAALNFPLGHPAITSIIPGPVRDAELADNLAHFQAAIPAGLWEELRTEGLIHPDAPAPTTPALL